MGRLTKIWVDPNACVYNMSSIIDKAELDKTRGQCLMNNKFDECLFHHGCQMSRVWIKIRKALSFVMSDVLSELSHSYGDILVVKGPIFWMSLSCFMTCLLNQISNLEWTDKLKQFAKWWRNPVLLTMFSIMFWILINQSVTLVSENTFDTVKGLKVDWLLKWSFQQSIRTWVFNKYGFPENMGPSLQGKVCLVTGAARGIGRGWELRFLISMFPSFHKYWWLHCGWFWELTNEKSGIALQLGGAGATVYITGRTLANLEDCAKEIKVLEQRVRWTIEHCYCVTRAPVLNFIRSWVALSFKVVSLSVCQACVTPFQISTLCNI